MPDDKELAASLKLAKTKPMFFAFVAKGTEGKLLLDKKKLPPKDVAEAKKECGGGVVYKGRCKGEEGVLVFEMAKEAPGNLAAQVKKTIKQEAALTLDVVFRVAADLENEDAETEATEQASSEAPPAAPPPPTATPGAPPAGDAGKRVAERLKALVPIVQKLDAASPTATEAKAQLAEANKLYLAKQYDPASAALDKAEALIKQALSTGGKPAAPPPSAPDAARVAARLKALEPIVLKIEGVKSQEAKDVRQAMKEASDFNAKKKYAEANETLDIAEPMLKQLIAGLAKAGASGTPPTEGKLSLVKLGKARIEWLGIRTKAVSDMQRLKDALTAEFKDDAGESATLNNALKTLDGMIAQLNEDLGNQLDAVLNAKDDTQRNGQAATAKATMAKFIQFVENDPIMAELDGNEVLPDMQVTGPMKAKLNEIAAALG